MKTLVIHPKDSTTAFLAVVYEGKDWTIVTENIHRSELIELIKSHDRIIMMGHGLSTGLLGNIKRNDDGILLDYSIIVDSKMVYLLKEKECICIWCNADDFVEKYGLRGFYTGMIISEYEEACVFLNVKDFTDADIDESNMLFTLAVKNSIDSESMLVEMQKNYNTDGNNKVIKYNQDNLYQSTTVL